MKSAAPKDSNAQSEGLYYTEVNEVTELRLLYRSRANCQSLYIPSYIGMDVLSWVTISMWPMWITCTVRIISFIPN